MLHLADASDQLLCPVLWTSMINNNHNEDDGVGGGGDNDDGGGGGGNVDDAGTNLRM